MTDEVFFSEKKAAAVLKHGILSRYVLPFATKVASRSKDGRVVVLDGYAGEGRYDDRSPGSPIYMIESARAHAAQKGGPRSLELIFIEREKPRVAKLRALLEEEAPDVEWQTLQGSVEDHLDDVLKQAEGVPFFAFLDPCGLGLTFDDIVHKIYGRPDGNYSPGTEILVNFSAEAVRRIGGRLKEPEDAKGRNATLARMDAVCGDDWWRAVYQGAANPEEASELIASEYFHRLIKATGAIGWVVEVKNAEHQQPKYSLVFLSRHPDGLLHFGEAFSGAQEEWRRAVIRGTLLDDDDLFAAAEAELARGWIDHMKDNVREIMKTNHQFIIKSKYREVMGDAAGDARMTHLRKALKELKKEGVLASDGSGSPLWDQLVVRPLRVA